MFSKYKVNQSPGLIWKMSARTMENPSIKCYDWPSFDIELDSYLILRISISQSGTSLSTYNGFNIWRYDIHSKPIGGVGRGGIRPLEEKPYVVKYTPPPLKNCTLCFDTLSLGLGSLVYCDGAVGIHFFHLCDPWMNSVCPFSSVMSSSGIKQVM